MSNNKNKINNIKRKKVAQIQVFLINKIHVCFKDFCQELVELFNMIGFLYIPLCRSFDISNVHFRNFLDAFTKAYLPTTIKNIEDSFKCLEATIEKSEKFGLKIKNKSISSQLMTFLRILRFELTKTLNDFFLFKSSEVFKFKKNELLSPILSWLNRVEQNILEFRTFCFVEVFCELNVCITSEKKSKKALDKLFEQMDDISYELTIIKHLFIISQAQEEIINKPIFNNNIFFILHIICFFKFLFIKNNNNTYLLDNHVLLYQRAFLGVVFFISNVFLNCVEGLICSSLFSTIRFDFRFVTNFKDVVFVNKTKAQGLVIYQKIKMLVKNSFTKINQFVDLTAVDMLGQKDIKNRFYVYYIFFSTRTTTRFFFSFVCSLHTSLPTLSDFFPSTSWAERECFDMFGLKFKEHKDLRRILTDYGFRGFPLRKDFPVTGFLQVKFDEVVLNVVYEKLNLMQLEREISFINPWNVSHKELLTREENLGCAFKFVVQSYLYLSFIKFYNFLYYH